MQWTDQIRNVKIFLVVAAVLIAVASLVVSHFLVRDLAVEERNRMEVWAAAMSSLNSPDENTDMALVLKVIEGNNTIPVIVRDDEGNVQTFRNVRLEGLTLDDSLQYAAREAERMFASGRYIRISLDGEGEVKSQDYIEVCYDESVMIKRLNVYPYVQLGVVMIFVVVAIFALLTSKRAEQNKVWVGLSKETAHQLGTPISSLMAWTEILKESYPDDALLPEMDKDVKRLQLIAERFSKIGSLPEPVPASLIEVMNHVVDYMDRRTSQKVQMIRHFPEHDVIVRINASLFEWVVENLCKNAVDAMGGSGTITLTILDSRSERQEMANLQQQASDIASVRQLSRGELVKTSGFVAIEVSDTGKGIKKKDLKNVFKPGFTTKKRGWGLGLSLAKRIVEEYHHGRIFVKSSEVGHGTTFRIELKA